MDVKNLVVLLLLINKYYPNGDYLSLSDRRDRKLKRRKTMVVRLINEIYNVDDEFNIDANEDMNEAIQVDNQSNNDTDLILLEDEIVIFLFISNKFIM